MTVAYSQCQVFVDDIRGVNGPPVVLHPHKVADGVIVGGLLFVFRRQREPAGNEDHHVAFKYKIIAVRKPDVISVSATTSSGPVSVVGLLLLFDPVVWRYIDPGSIQWLTLRERMQTAGGHISYHTILSYVV